MKFKYIFFTLLSLISLNQLNSQLNCLPTASHSLDINGELNVVPPMIANGDFSEYDSLWVVPNKFYCDDIGEHNVVLFGKTPNGLIHSCSSTLTVVDNLPPVAVVESSINVAFNGGNTITVLPEMVDGGSYDNCTDMTMTVEPAVLDCNTTSPSYVTLTLTDAYGNSNQAWTEVIITDVASNDYECADFNFIHVGNGSVEITLDDVLANGQPCIGDFSFQITSSNGDVPSDNIFTSNHVGNTYTITVSESNTGTNCSFDFTVITGQVPYNICVKDGAGVGVPNVQIGDSNVFTDGQGCAVFNATPGDVLTFSKQGDNLDGVDIEDFTIAKQHILGQVPLASSASVIAGDINKNKILTTLDAVLLVKTIDGSGNSALPWIFYDSRNGGPNANTYLSTPQTLVLGNHYDQTILAVKKGDLNFSADQLVQEDDKTSLIVQDKALVEGEKYLIPLVAETDVSMIALQLSMPLETDDFKILAVNSSFPTYTFGIQDDVAQFLWYSEDNKKGTEFTKGEMVVELEIIAKKNSVLHKSLQLLKSKANKQVQLNSDKGETLKISFDGLITVPTNQVEFNTDITIYPNPVKDRLVIDVHSNEVQIESINIFAIDGRLIQDQHLDSNSTLDLSSVQPGMYILQINTTNGHAVKRLIQKQ